MEAIADRLIPPDGSGPGGKQAGCAVFIDRQLAGSFGDSRGLYMRPPFANGTPSQGLQSPIVPKERYRISLAALEDYCKTTFAGKGFVALSAVQQDQVQRPRALLRGRQRFKISRSALTLRAQVPGISADKFASIAREAELNCPVSKVLKAEITLDAKLG